MSNKILYNYDSFYIGKIDDKDVLVYYNKTDGGILQCMLLSGEEILECTGDILDETLDSEDYQLLEQNPNMIIKDWSCRTYGSSSYRKCNDETNLEINKITSFLELLVK